jgi:glycerol-3-phosphate dehydrogenase
LCRLNCISAKKNNGILLEHVEINKIKKQNRYILSTNRGEFEADYVINATGPWIIAIAKMMGVSIPLTYSQGTIVVQETLSPRGIQYFHEPSDADAYIVHGENGWLGTTSTTIKGPEDAKPEPWANNYLKDKFSIILPDIKKQKTLKMFTGIRPLFKEEKNISEGRAISRNFKIFESPNNFLHIVGGKLTTARLMAEEISEIISKKEGNTAKCRTDREPLVDS